MNNIKYKSTVFLRGEYNDDRVKLLCGNAAVSDFIKYGNETAGISHTVLQFSFETAPIVVWNVKNRCNLACRHCYSDARDKHSAELSTAEAKAFKAFIVDLAKMKVPVLLFFGGRTAFERRYF